MVYIQEMSNILYQNIYGISIEGLVIFFVIILSTFIIRSVLLYVIYKKMSKLKISKLKTTKLGAEEFEIIGSIINATKEPFGYLILIQGFYIAIIYLRLPEKVGPFTIDSIAHITYVLAASFTVLYFAFRVIDIIGTYIDKKVKDKNSVIDEHVAKLITKSLQILIVTIGILSILSNFGYNITSLITGLGLGGLAFALAAQTTISNVFGSATIFSDKPFRVGDIIEIEDVKGTVEEIGLRSTRIRRYDQALAIVPNSKFISNDIINYSSINKRRIEFFIKITYDASIHDINAVVNGVKKIIEEDERFDHMSHIVKFTDFGEWSLDIYVYILVKIVDFAEFQAVREDLNIKIMRLLDDLGVKMAFPSKTIYLTTNNNNMKSDIIGK